MSSGRLTAAEFTLTLSAPERRSFLASSKERTPPPTVRGMKTLSATLATTSRRMARSSWVAEMSRKTSSSAPASS